jgi:hypothetical protein
MTHAYKMARGELVTARKTIAEQQKLLNTRKQRTKGKRVALKGWFVFSTEEIFDIGRGAEAATAARTTKKSSRKHPIDHVDEVDEFQVFENDFSSSESDCTVLSCRK